MRIFTQVNTLHNYLNSYRKAGKTIGLVPTMGALHSGHLSLVAQAKRENDLVVCSIYVNPTQFNNPADLSTYPRTLKADRKLLKNAASDVLFVPTDEVMYPQETRLRFDFGALETVMEGKFRPGHFNGVGIVVSKLLHMVLPDAAYFGQKDLQQFAVIQQLIKDLSFNVRLVRCPTVREADGLAMSSRNARLSADERKIAPVLYRTLQWAKQWIGQIPVLEIQQVVAGQLANVPLLRLEYFEVVDSNTLLPVENLPTHSQISLCMAAYVGEIRLIDNVFLDET